MAQIRYIVDDVEEAVAFYAANLGFSLVEQFGPAIAILERATSGSGSRAPSHLPQGRCPTEGSPRRAAGAGS